MGHTLQVASDNAAIERHVKAAHAGISKWLSPRQQCRNKTAERAAFEFFSYLIPPTRGQVTCTVFPGTQSQSKPALRQVSRTASCHKSTSPRRCDLVASAIVGSTRIGGATSLKLSIAGPSGLLSTDPGAWGGSNGVLTGVAGVEEDCGEKGEGSMPFLMALVCLRSLRSSCSQISVARVEVIAGHGSIICFKSALVEICLTALTLAYESCVLPCPV